MCYVVGVASSGKVWLFFCFSMHLRGAEQLFFCRDPPLFRAREFLTTWHNVQLFETLRYSNEVFFFFRLKNYDFRYFI